MRVLYDVKHSYMDSYALWNVLESPGLMDQLLLLPIHRDTESPVQSLLAAAEFGVLLDTQLFLF